MTKYKYKISEEKETFSATEVDPALIQRVEKTYGPVNMKYDFFSSDLKTYFKTKSVDPETGSVDSQVIKLASFTDSLEKLYAATEALSALVKSPDGKDDAVVVKSYGDLKTIFNNFRSHLRKYYPDQYEAIKNKLDEISTIASNSGFTSGGEGENYATPFAFGRTKSTKGNYGAYTQAGFKKVTEGPGATMGPGPKAGPTGVTKNKYVTDFKYTLVKNPLKEVEDTEQFLDDMQINDPARRKFVKSRLLGFDAVEDKLNQLVPMMQQAKNKTIDYYRNNPDSYAVVYGTDLAQEYLNDLINLFNEQ